MDKSKQVPAAAEAAGTFCPIYRRKYGMIEEDLVCRR